MSAADMHSLSDAYSSDERRTMALERLGAAYGAWATWEEPRQREIMASVAELTIRRVLPIALRAVGLEAEALRCEADGDAASARAAEYAYWINPDPVGSTARYLARSATDECAYAGWAMAADAINAAVSAAVYTSLAAKAAITEVDQDVWAAAEADAARAIEAADNVLDVAVKCWIEAAS